MVYNTFIDGVIPTPGFTLYHLPSEATLLQQLYSGQLPDTGCNSGNGRIVCHWHQIQNNCHTVGTQKYCEGTIYYQRLSYGKIPIADFAVSVTKVFEKNSLKCSWLKIGRAHV